MGTRLTLKNGHGEKYESEYQYHHVSPTPRSDLRYVNVFFGKLLVKMSSVFSVDGKYCNDITYSCTKLLM